MGEQKHILIVEDDAEWRENILREALESQGYYVITSATYKEAIRILDEATLDLLVADVNLTGVSGNQDGIKIVERIAEMGKRTAVIVVSSSETLAVARGRVGKFGSIAFIDKTAFDIVEFVNTVVNVLSYGTWEGVI